VSGADSPRAPDGLRPSGRAFWRKITGVYELAPAEVALLGRACRVLDMLAEIDRRLGREGLVVKGSSGQPRAHPLVASVAELSRTLEVLVRGMCLPAPWEGEGSRRSPQQQAAAQERWRRERGRGEMA
jgi:phage terminase small subunit